MTASTTLILTLATAAYAGQPTQTAVYGEAAGATPAQRLISGGAWGSAQMLGDLTGRCTGFVCVPAPSEDLLALLSVTEDERLTLRLRSSGMWGGDSTLDSSIGGTGNELFAGAFEQKSGEMLIAYRNGSSSNVSFRIYDGALYGSQSVSLGLPSAPVAIELAPEPGSDRMVMVVASASSLHAAVWDGNIWGNTVTLDSSYSAGRDGFSITHETSTGVGVVAWARPSDTTVRVRRWDTGAWETQTSGPSLGGAINRVVLAPDRDPESPRIAGAFSSSSGGAERLHASFWDGSSWGSTTQISSDLEGVNSPYDLAWEPQGGSAVVAWADQSDTRVRTRRWSGSWGAAQNAGDTGFTIEELLVAPDDETDGRVFALARTDEPGAGGGQYVYYDYVAYSDGGSVDSSGVSYSGPTGENEPGVSVPPVPGISSGGPDVTPGSGNTITLAPGSYGKVDAAKEVTINLSSGEYAFEEFKAEKEVLVDCDTSSGDVVIVVDNGNFQVQKEFVLRRSGAYAVILHIVNGDFQAEKEADIDAAIIVHNGNIQFKKEATVAGHLIASGNIEFEKDSTVDPPGWQLSTTGYGSGGSAIGRLWSVTLDSGSPGALAELTPTAGWSVATPLPIAASVQPPERITTRVVRWQEIQPD